MDGTNERGDSRRFLCYAPFSVAHLRRREEGIWIRVCLSPGSSRLLALFSLIRICSARIVSVPGGVVVSGVAWGDLASRPSVPSPRLALRLVRFPRIGLRAEEVRRFCQLILLCHSLAAAIVFFFRLACSSRSSSRLLRLVGASRGYSLRFALASRPVRQFIGVSLPRLVRRLVRRPVFSSRLCRFVRHLVRSSRQAVRILIFVRRLVISSCGIGLWSSSRSFCSRLISLVCVSWSWGRRRLVILISWRRAFVPIVSRRGIRLGDGVGGMVMPFNDTGDAPFYSARFPNQAMTMAMTIWNRAAGVGERKCGDWVIWGNGERQRWGQYKRIDEQAEGMIDTMTART